jgi:hypothetical protein
MFFLDNNLPADSDFNQLNLELNSLAAVGLSTCPYDPYIDNTCGSSCVYPNLHLRCNDFGGMCNPHHAYNFEEDVIVVAIDFGNSPKGDNFRDDLAALMSKQTFMVEHIGIHMSTHKNLRHASLAWKLRSDFGHVIVGSCITILGYSSGPMYENNFMRVAQFWREDDDLFIGFHDQMLVSFV